MRSGCMQITEFSAVGREMPYFLSSSTKAAMRIKPKKGSPALVEHPILTVPRCLLEPNNTYVKAT